MDTYTYLLINIASIGIPFVAGFHPRLVFYRNWKYLLPSIVLTAIPFIVWDIWFTVEGVWGFNPAYLTGIRLFDLPMEEWLFFVCIPYACVFTYEALIGLISKEFLPYHRHLTAVLAVLLLVFGLIFIQRAYTSLTFLSTALILGIHRWWIKSNYMGAFYGAFLLILFPFFLVNGTLTGSFIEDEVVWYNDRENLGIRLFTIPVEDVIYALLLLLGNVTWYEKLKQWY